jgi:hypothetical protein
MNSNQHNYGCSNQQTYTVGCPILPFLIPPQRILCLPQRCIIGLGEGMKSEEQSDETVIFIDEVDQVQVTEE